MAESRPDIRAVPAGYDSNVRRRAHSPAGTHPGKLGFAARIAAAAAVFGIGAHKVDVQIEEPVQAVVRTVEDVVGQGKELVDRDLTDEQKKADVLLKEALRNGDDRSIVRNVMADPKSPNKIKFRRRPSTILSDPNGNIALEDPITEFDPGTNFGSGLVVEGMDPEHPKDPRKRSLWVVVRHPKTGEPGFIQADNVELAGYPTGAIYNFPPKSLK